jgi:glycosyltransferase involved in cell wall biosynthesis
VHSDAETKQPALPRISVITPSFNHAKFLAAAMDSVLSQHYPGLEYIVMDGGSKDGSADIIRARADGLAYWQSERDGGQANALNMGLARTTGDIIGWVNSDDLYVKGALETMLLYGDCLHINEHDRVVEAIQPGPFDPAKLAYRCYLMQMSVFFRREMLERIGSFDTRFPYALDYDLWLRAGIALKDNIAYLPQTLSCYRAHEQSQSVRDVLPALFDAIEVRRKLVAMRPQPEWLAPISGDIFRAPLIQLLAAAHDSAAWPAILGFLTRLLGADALSEGEWTRLGQFLTMTSPNAPSDGPDLLIRVERRWMVACGGIETDGHEAWLVKMLLELGWQHFQARHIRRGLALFSEARMRDPSCSGQVLRWRLVEGFVRAWVGQGLFHFLRGLKRKAIGLFSPSLSR